jgi:hypothetical protein
VTVTVTKSVTHSVSRARLSSGMAAARRAPVAKRKADFILNGGRSLLEAVVRCKVYYLSRNKLALGIYLNVNEAL